MNLYSYINNVSDPDYSNRLQHTSILVHDADFTTILCAYIGDEGSDPVINVTCESKSVISRFVWHELITPY